MRNQIPNLRFEISNLKSDISNRILDTKSKRVITASLLVLLGILSSYPASADSLHDRIQQANGLLRSGEADKALESYHEIQIDHPDAPVLDFNVGCAEYEKGIKALQSDDDKKKDTAPMSQAVESFDRAMQSNDPVVSTSAAFNRGNSLAQIAKSTGDDLAKEDRAKAFQSALRAYDDVLNTDPKNEGAKQNIDHLRYMMKKAPPPPPPQQGGDDSKPQDNQSGTDQNKQQQDQNDPSNQQNQQKPDNSQQQQQKNQQQENKDNQSQPDKQQDQQNQADNNDQQQQDSGQSEQDPTEEQKDAGTPPPDKQSVEALLQSLENQDKEMQKDLRKGARTARVRPSGWW